MAEYTSGVSRSSPLIGGKINIAIVTNFVFLSMFSLFVYLMHSVPAHECAAVSSISFVYSLFLWTESRKALAVVNSVQEVLEEACLGNFLNRVVDAQGMGEVGYVAWQVNDLLDVIQTYVHEVDMASSNAEEWLYDRPIHNRGFPPVFSRLLNYHSVMIAAIRDFEDAQDQEERLGQLSRKHGEKMLHELGVVHRRLNKVLWVNSVSQRCAKQHAGSRMYKFMNAREECVIWGADKVRNSAFIRKRIDPVKYFYSIVRWGKVGGRIHPRCRCSGGSLFRAVGYDYSADLVSDALYRVEKVIGWHKGRNVCG